jgi:hypothetical protein
MAEVTTLTEVTDQIQKYWAPMFTKELRASLLLGSLVNKDYQGEIRKGGDSVTVSQVNSPTGDLLTVGTDAGSFESEQLSMSHIHIQATKRAVASFEFEDLVSLQSQIDEGNSDVRESLLYAMNKQIEDYLITLINPSTSAPDHLVSSVTDFNAAQLAATRLLAAAAKWPKDKPWYCLLSPSYYSDFLNATTMTSSDYGATDAPLVSGQVALKRMGFNIYENDNFGTDIGLSFYPDWLHLVQQTNVQVKVSDLHSQKKFGYVISCDLIFGAALGINGNVKHIKTYNS